MDPPNAHPAESRPPTLEDLLRLCRSLNEHGARYIVVGGFAVIQHGFTRATEAIDLLVEPSPENQRRVKQALEVLPDRAVRELGDDDLRNWLVVRVADEVVVDLMLSAGGISYHEASREVETVVLRGVPVPFASPRLLLRMKQSPREKDILDRQFLEMKVRPDEPAAQ